jgi:hypothetical protein
MRIASSGMRAYRFTFNTHHSASLSLCERMENASDVATCDIIQSARDAVPGRSSPNFLPFVWLDRESLTPLTKITMGCTAVLACSQCIHMPRLSGHLAGHPAPGHALLPALYS